MRQLVVAFISFSRLERLGISVLAALLMILIIIRCTLTLWVHPAGPDKDRQKALMLAYSQWKKGEDSLRLASLLSEGEASTIKSELFAFDPNSLDSIGFIRLGMPVKAVKGLLNWRRKGKHFYKPEDLKPLYNLPPETYARLQPYIRISDDGEEARPNTWSTGNSHPAIPSVIELNTADSTLLDRGVNGIGATLARKIVARRTALGGFIRHEQLLEVYRFPDTTFQKLKTCLHIDMRYVHKMNLNALSLNQMSAHPYVGEAVAKNILLYKEGIGRYAHVEQLREVPLMSEEIYRKIAPYFVVE